MSIFLFLQEVVSESNHVEKKMAVIKKKKSAGEESFTAMKTKKTKKSKKYSEKENISVVVSTY